MDLAIVITERRFSWQIERTTTKSNAKSIVESTEREEARGMSRYAADDGRKSAWKVGYRSNSRREKETRITRAPKRRNLASKNARPVHRARKKAIAFQRESARVSTISKKRASSPSETIQSRATSWKSRSSRALGEDGARGKRKKNPMAQRDESENGEMKSSRRRGGGRFEGERTRRGWEKGLL